MREVGYTRFKWPPGERHRSGLVQHTRVSLQGAEFPGSFSDPLRLGKFAGDLSAARWVQVRIPLSEFRTGSIYKFRLFVRAKCPFFFSDGLTASHTL